MQVDNTVELIDHMGSDLTVVNAARVSFGKRKEKFTISDGKKIKLYKSRIGRAEIKIENNDAILHLFPNGKYEKDVD